MKKKYVVSLSIIIVLVFVSVIIYKSKSYTLSELLQKESYEFLWITDTFSQNKLKVIEDFDEREELYSLLEEVRVKRIGFWENQRYSQSFSIITADNHVSIYDNKYIAFSIDSKRNVFEVVEDEVFQDMLDCYIKLIQLN